MRLRTTSTYFAAAGLVLFAAACSEPDQSGGPSNAEHGAGVVAVVGENRAILIPVADSTRAILAGLWLRSRGGVGVPGIERMVGTAPDGAVIVSEVTRGEDGRIVGLRTIRNGVALLESVIGSDGRASHRVGGGRIKIDASLAGVQVGLSDIARATAPGGGGGQDDCALATAAYYLAWGTLLLVVATTPLDPTPLQLLGIALAAANAANAQANMHFWCNQQQGGGTP